MIKLSTFHAEIQAFDDEKLWRVRDHHVLFLQGKLYKPIKKV